MIKTKIFFNKARLIRFPIVVRGKQYIDWGNNLTTGRQCRIDVNGTFIAKSPVLVFGKNVNMGDNVRISCCKKITIGNNVLMGEYSGV